MGTHRPPQRVKGQKRSYLVRFLFLAWTSVVWISACELDRDSPMEPDESPAAEILAGQAAWSDVGVPEGSIDAAFLAVNNSVPGFGGMIMEDGLPTIMIKAGVDAEQARQSLLPLFAERNVAGVAPRVRTVDYEWRELTAWRSVLMVLMKNSHVVWADANEALNRVEFGVLDGFDERLLAEEIDRRGVPREAVLFTVTDPVTALADLTDSIRPVLGGHQIQGVSILSECTLGFNLKYGSTKSFFTASHCSGDLFEQTDDSMWQSTRRTAGQLVGTESWDPSPFDDTHACDTAWTNTFGGDPLTCRGSDAALFSYEDDVEHVRGWIAKTTSSSRTSGSTTIAGHFKVTDTHTSVVGDTLQKIGRTTGWTYGDVETVCAHIKHPWDEDVLMICQDLVEAGVDGGDSGAPVFLQVNANDIKAAGILWGVELSRFGGRVNPDVFTASHPDGVGSFPRAAGE